MQSHCHQQDEPQKQGSEKDINDDVPRIIYDRRIS